MVDQAFANKYFPGENPIGKHITPGLGDGITDSPSREIIGVVGSVKRKGLTADTAAQFYLPLKQAIMYCRPRWSFVRWGTRSTWWDRCARCWHKWITTFRSIG